MVKEDFLNQLKLNDNILKTSFKYDRPNCGTIHDI